MIIDNNVDAVVPLFDWLIAVRTTLYRTKTAPYGYSEKQVKVRCTTTLNGSSRRTYAQQHRPFAHQTNLHPKSSHRYITEREVDTKGRKQIREDTDLGPMAVSYPPKQTRRQGTTLHNFLQTVLI